ncbi:MAG TPA: hypothetical protein PKY82_07915 [Pyrinomonadaceae bacterium]|nr:hypothetical protein [Pyrinomonadaceae bacterium]
MKVKIIKKTENMENKNISFFQENVPPQKKKVEEKVIQNVLGWVEDLREKKRFEFINSQALLNGLK